jgi:hypothetical protein
VCHAIRLHPGARQNARRTDLSSSRLDNAAPIGAKADDRLSKPDLTAATNNIVGVAASHEPEVDRPCLGDVKRTNADDVRLDLADVRTIQFAEAGESVQLAPALQLGETGELAFALGDNELAIDSIRNVLLVREPQEQLTSETTESRL